MQPPDNDYQRALEEFIDMSRILSDMGLRPMNVESPANNKTTLQKVAHGPHGLTLSLLLMRYSASQKRPGPVVCVEFRVASGKSREHVLKIECHLADVEWTAELVDPDTDPNRSGWYPRSLVRLLAVSPIRFQTANRMKVEPASAREIIKRMADIFLNFRQECA